MNKVILVVAAVGLGFGGWSLTTVKNELSGGNKTRVEESVGTVGARNVDGGVELWINSDSKVSAVEFNLTSDNELKTDSFEPNKDIFNTVLLNKKEGQKISVSMGVMKAVSELPEGKLVLGKVSCQPGNGKLLVDSLKLIGPGVDGKASQQLVTDFEFSVAVE